MTTTTKTRETSKVILLAVLLTAFAVILASCGTMPPYDKLGLRTSVGAGLSHVKAEVENPSTGDKEHESATGENYGVRLETFRRPMENTTAGLRLQGSFRDVSEDGFGTGGTGELGLEVYGAELHAVFRHYFPVSNAVRPFAEMFGGVGYYDGELTASGGGLSSPLSDSDHDWSAVGGGGLGIEFDVSDKASIFIQGDYSIRLNDSKRFEFQSQDGTIWVGGEIRF